MRQLVLSMFVSVDGFVNGPAGAFIDPEWSNDLDAWTMEMVERYDTLVYGRKAWQEMAEYWPTAPEDDSVPDASRILKRFMNDSQKIVFSNTLQSADAWSNSKLASRSIAEELASAKSSSGRDIVIFAGANFAHAAEATGLIDEYAILTIPKLFGGGCRLFADAATTRPLELLEARTMNTGAILTRYAVRSL